MNKKTYFYTPCDGGINVNKDFRFYFRLYVQMDDDIPKLLEQGREDLVEGWRDRYKAELDVKNPYSELD